MSQLSPVPLAGTGNLTSATVTNSATLTAAKPANLADRDLLVAVPYSRNTGTWSSTPSGWAELHTQNTIGHLSIFAKYVASAAGEGASSYSWVNSSANRGGILLFRVTGAYPAIPLDATGAVVTSGTTQVVDPAVTAGKTDGLLLSVNVTNQTAAPASVLTPPASMTELANVTITGTGAPLTYLEVAYQSLNNAGSTGTRTFTASPTIDSSAAGLMITLAPLMYGAAVLSATSALADINAKIGAHGAANLSAASALLSTGKLGAKGAANLAAASALTASASTPSYQSMVAGAWQAATLYQGVGGAWVQT